MNRSLYLISIGTAISACGSKISLLAISARLFELDPSGALSSQVIVLQLLGFAIFGLIGAGILRRFLSVQIGATAPIVSGLLSLSLFVRDSPHSSEYLAVAFLQSMLFGLEHPNMMRFLNSYLSFEKRGKYFSIAQSAQQISLLAAPAIAVGLIKIIGVRWCFLIDATTYFLSASLWIPFFGQRPPQANTSPQTFSFFEGYKILVQNPEVRSLGLFRLFNHFAYTTFTISIPIWAAQISKNAGAVHLQATSDTILALGTICASLLGGSILARCPGSIVRYPFLSSIFGFTSVGIVVIFPTEITLVLASLILGLGQYFFRLTGMVIGVTVTPAPALASVIVAGDTTTRAAAFGIGSLVPFLAQLSGSMPWILPFSAVALIAPRLARRAVSAVTNSTSAPVPSVR